jgi:type VI secretion system secreted protein Hcp
MFNAYVNFGDIKGEVTEKDHKDWVQVQSVTFDVTQPVSPGGRTTAGGATANAAEFSPVTIEKLIDKSSPKLFEAIVKGTHLAEVTIDYTRASGDSAIKYLEIKLKDVLVSGVSHRAATGSDFPMEMISLTYGAIEKTYTQQDNTGKSKGNVAVKWNVAQSAAA